MLLESNARFIGRKSGQGKNGAWYQISCIADDEVVTMRCSGEAYERCNSLTMGDDMQMIVSLRLYQRDWIPRIETLNI